MYYVYVLKSLNNHSLYIGSTSDITNRVKEHNSGASLSTKRYIPWVLIYSESYFSKEDALIREHNLKYRGNAIAQLKRRIRNSLNTKQVLG